jgi:hypothetical protein
MNNSFKISEEQLKILESLLKQTPILLNDDSDFEKELKEVYRLIPRLKPYNKDSHLLPHIGKAHTTIKYYSLSNEKLNDYIREIFNEPNKELIVVSEVSYEVGGFALPHFDPDSNITYNLMIGDSFQGGDVHLEEVLQDFYKRGDVVFFNGANQRHSVSEITAGKRVMMSIWFSSKETKQKMGLL